MTASSLLLKKHVPPPTTTTQGKKPYLWLSSPLGVILGEEGAESD